MNSPIEPTILYEIGGRRWARGTPGLAEAIAEAHARHLRPRCLCLPDNEGAEMYVARLMEGYTVKRMPNTGSQHATSCPSYEPPAEFSGLGQLVGTAIVENPATGETALKLDFPMTKLPGRSTLPAAASASSSVASQGPKLGLRALLHYLWDQAELTHWKPGFAGRRTWGTVRKHLLQAAENKFTHGHALLASLYIPEVFSVEQREAITTRRLRQWARAQPKPGQPQPLMLLVPKHTLVARYYDKQKALFLTMTAGIETRAAMLAELEEDHAGLDGAFSELDKINKTEVAALLKKIKHDKEFVRASPRTSTQSFRTPLRFLTSGWPMCRTATWTFKKSAPFGSTAKTFAGIPCCLSTF